LLGFFSSLPHNGYFPVKASPFTKEVKVYALVDNLPELNKTKNCLI